MLFVSKKINKGIFILFVFLFNFIFLFSANIADAGLGISPSRITVKHLLRDSLYEQTFVLSRSNPKESLDFRILVDDSIKNWITTDKGAKFNWPADQQRFPVNIIVEPPSDTPNGLYKGSIRFISMPESMAGGEGSGAAIVLAAAVQAELTITGEQVLEYTIAATTIKTAEENSPITLILTIHNTGNVKAKPTKVHIDIYDKFKEKLLESHDITEMGFVNAFQRGDIIIEIPNKLNIGQYWAVVSVYKDEILLTEDPIMFEIVMAGSLQKQGIFKDILIETGEIIKIIGVFENTGQADLSAKLVSEIYRDNKLIDLVESELAMVGRGKTGNLFAYFKPTDKGQYTLKAHISYSGKSTAVKELRFKYGLEGRPENAAVYFVLAGAIIIIILSIIGYHYRRYYYILQKFFRGKKIFKLFGTSVCAAIKQSAPQGVIQHPYKTKLTSQIKFLDRSLEKLEFNEEKKLYQILLTQQDFRESQTTSKDMIFVIKELKTNFGIPCFPGSDLLILWENQDPGDLIKGIFYSSKSLSLKSVLNNFEGIARGNRALFVVRENNLDSAREKLLKFL